MGVKRFSNKELHELFNEQCAPCISDPIVCSGDIEKAKKFKCYAFASGFVVIERR